MLVQATTTLECHPERVFENESVILVLSFEQTIEYSSTWDFNGTDFAYLWWNNGLCNINNINNISVTYEMLCNSTTVSIKIEKVKKYMHGLTWKGSFQSDPKSISIFIKGNILIILIYL